MFQDGRTLQELLIKRADSMVKESSGIMMMGIFSLDSLGTTKNVREDCISCNQMALMHYFKANNAIKNLAQT
jgi:hypothetical protein